MTGGYGVVVSRVCPRLGLSGGEAWSSPIALCVGSLGLIALPASASGTWRRERVRDGLVLLDDCQCAFGLYVASGWRCMTAHGDVVTGKFGLVERFRAVQGVQYG